jgi:hypothetical protein
LRSILTVVFVAALVAAPALSNAAPRSIDDCEKIQAADAYNQCLAVFGPLARGHGAAGDGMAIGTGPEPPNTGMAIPQPWRSASCQVTRGCARLSISPIRIYV